MSSTAILHTNPIKLNIDDEDFSNINLKLSNYFHVYVGKIDNKHMVLPLDLQLHSSMLPIQIDHDNTNNSIVNNKSKCIIPTSILPTILKHLPTMISDCNIAKIKLIKSKSKLIETKQFVFTYQWKQTLPHYHIMTLRLKHAKKPKNNNNNNNSKDILNFDDDDNNNSNSNNNNNNNDTNNDANYNIEDSDYHSSDDELIDDTDDEEYYQNYFNDNNTTNANSNSNNTNTANDNIVTNTTESKTENKQEVSTNRKRKYDPSIFMRLADPNNYNKYNTNNSDDDGEVVIDEPYLGGAYRSFNVSKHALYIRAIAKSEAKQNLFIDSQ